MLYALALLGAFSIFYLTVVCYKKHKKNQQAKIAEEINKKYFRT